ncbi:MAG: hypothetical protein LQ344_000987 [Seirophora lacunosa]|nr:MAG: hypothetical protein LQ344_000987 [Seirophora lacunosa]
MDTEGQPPLLSSGKSLLPYILDCREQVFKTKTAMQSLGMFSVQEIDQPVKDAFLRPDRDIMAVVTAEPDITTTQIRPESQDFLITAKDGFWFHTSSEHAVDLVGRWLAENKLEPPTLGKTKVDRARVEQRMAGIIDTLFSKEPPSDGGSPGRDRTNTKKVNEENFVVVGGNAAPQRRHNLCGMRSAGRKKICCQDSFVRSRCRA